MKERYDVVVVGAGIIGLATGLHILKGDSGLDVLVVDRLKGPGRGNTAKSAAAYRDMFTSPVNRKLAQGSINFYEEVQERSGRIGLRRVGYLWLMTGEQVKGNREALEYLASVRVVFDLLEPDELKRLLPGFVPGDVKKGVLGSRCGILNQNHLSEFYSSELKRVGGSFAYGSTVSGLSMGGGGDVDGINLGDKRISAGTVVLATGAWTGEIVKGTGIEAPVVPKKRQLFSVRTKGDDMKRLLKVKGFNSHNLMPFTIVPGGAYMRPAANAIIMGFSDRDREPGLEERPVPEPGFFKERVLPQVVEHFPMFENAVPEHSWAGHYAYHPPDNMPFVYKDRRCILVGGASGSGVMKADSIGRVAAGLFHGKREVELGDGSYMKVAELGIAEREHPSEELLL